MSRPNQRLALVAFLFLPLVCVGTVELPGRTQPEVKRLIRQLGSESFPEREAASRALEAIGEPAQQALRTAINDSDPEVRRRAAELVEALVDRVRGEEVVALQGLWVLKTTEYLGEKADQDSTDDEFAKLDSRRRIPAELRGLDEDNSQLRTTLIFKGRTFEWRQWTARFSGGVGEVTSIEGIYHLDVDRSPKVMEKRCKPGCTRDESEITSWIYSVQGDTLLICASLTNDPRRLPTQFVTVKDKDVVLLTFKRAN